MYFKSIEINNYGCISDFNYEFRFDEKGNPIPCVLIGENGKGKTLVLANLVDLLVESKREVYGEEILETVDNKYFKVGSKNYIKLGNSFSRVRIDMGHEGKRCTLFDIMSREPNVDINNINTSELENSQRFLEHGYSKKVDCQLKKAEYDNSIFLYFPVDRYYYPMWFNKANEAISHDDDNNFINMPKYNLIKTNMFSETKKWLTDIFLEKVTKAITLPNDEKIPSQLRGQTFNALIDTTMQKIVASFLEIIKGVPVQSNHVFGRKNKMIGYTSSISSFNDVTQLSDGEMNLFSIALNIVMAWDITHNGDPSLDEITGVVIIDEVDAGLHIDYAYRALPKLLRMFPKVQFVLTSHSPFFLTGLKKEYGEDVDILTMPEGIKISTLDAFEEMNKAHEIFMDNVNELRLERDTLFKQMNEIKENKDKVLVYTEGKTDVILLEKALKKLNISDLTLDIRAAATCGKNNSDSVLKNLLESLQSNSNINNNIVIGIFDRDASPEIKIRDLSSTARVLNDEAYVKMGDKLYAFALPVPHGRTETNQISIEHYFSDAEIKTPASDGKRLFMGNEFCATGNYVNDSQNYFYKSIGDKAGTIRIIEHETKKTVTDRQGNGDYCLSKAIYAESVRDDVWGFDNFDFSEFNKIFDIIRQIIEQEGGHNDQL